MATRNLVPDRPQFPSQRESGGLDELVTVSFDRISTWIGALASFLVIEHPRGPAPIGPEPISAVAQKNAVVLKWRTESSASTVDFFGIYRAAAGTTDAPTTPLFSAANRISVVASARLQRQLPVNSVYTYADLDFSALDHTNGVRYLYWVTAIDNEYRESRPVVITTPVAVP